MNTSFPKITGIEKITQVFNNTEKRNNIKNKKDNPKNKGQNSKSNSKSKKPSNQTQKERCHLDDYI